MLYGEIRIYNRLLKTWSIRTLAKWANSLMFFWLEVRNGRTLSENINGRTLEHDDIGPHLQDCKVISMFDFLNEIQYLNTRTPKYGS